MRSDWCNAVYTLDLECAVIGWMIVCGVNSQLLLARWTIDPPPAVYHSTQLQVCSDENENSWSSRVVMFSFLLSPSTSIRHGELILSFRQSLVNLLLLLRCCCLQLTFALYSSLPYILFCSLSTVGFTPSRTAAIVRGVFQFNPIQCTIIF